MNSQTHKTMQGMRYSFKLLVLFFILLSCITGCNPINTSEYKIINNGGAVEIVEINPEGKSLEIIQAIPSYVLYVKSPINNNAPNRFGKNEGEQMLNPKSENLYPENLPIIFFFNQKLNLSSIKDCFEVIVNGENVKGTIIVSVTSKGNAILTFTPWEEFGSDKEVLVVVKKTMQSSEGVEMYSDYMIKFTTTPKVTGNFDINKNFEKGNEGVLFVGDGAVRTGTTGPLGPFEGENFAAISSGEKLVSKDGYSIGSASSLMVLGPIKKRITNLDFYYDFISAEFNEFIDSEFDDTAIITIYGPKGSHTEIITSVNLIGENNQPFIGYPNMPDDGDDYAGHTGWLLHKINLKDITSVGTPAYIIFTITDVGDRIYSSILAVDNLSY